MQDQIDILRSTPFFESLDRDELEAVARCVVPASFRAGEIIIQEGTPGTCLYIIERGRARVEKSKDGRTLHLADLGRGAAFGEMSLIDAVPTSATVVAADEIELLTIGRLDLNVLLSWNPVLASKMWRAFTRVLSTRLRDTNERLVARFGDGAIVE